MDEITDRLADILETIATELDQLSHRLFRSPVTEPASRRPPARESADLRIILRRVGNSGDLASKIRDSLHGIGHFWSSVRSAGVKTSSGWHEVMRKLPPRRRFFETQWKWPSLLLL